MNEIAAGKYRIVYDEDKAIVTLQGELMLSGAMAYEPILQFMTNAAEAQEGKKLSVDIRNLVCLNSSGINMLAKLVMFIRDVKNLPLTLTICAKEQVAWQNRLVINLQRLMPDLQAELE